MHNLHITSYSLSSYDLQPCYQASGFAQMPINREVINESGTTESTVAFNVCLSAQYSIPVSLSGTIKFTDASGANHTIALNLTQVSQKIT